MRHTSKMMQHCTRFLKSVQAPSKNYAVKSLDVIVRYRKKFLKIVCYIFDFNQMVFKFSFKKLGWSNCICIFISKTIPETWSTWRYCKIGSLEKYFRFSEVVFTMPCWVMMMYYLKLIYKRFWYCIIFNSKH